MQSRKNVGERRRQNHDEADPERWWKERQRRLNGGDWEPSGLTGLRSQPGESARAKTDKNDSSYGKGPNHPLGRFMKGLLIRTAIAGVLLAAAWAGLRLELPGSAEAKEWALDAVTRDMDFRAVEAWYGNTFGGSPSFLPSFRHQEQSRPVSAEWSRDAVVPPLAGRLVETFGEGGDGVRIAAEEGSPVAAVHTGRVTQVTADEEGAATISVQHANRVVTVYGNVIDPEVRPGDWVEAGQKLGELGTGRTGDGSLAGEGTLFFAIKQNGKTLDPAEVVPFD
ncbi:M23 family metallopeptidase [Cohnella algarum]|uniref:M23 family metallopeptidase n=1 Tax=Cohnella algarum TaxID=2044859 RepID=UPI00196895ED|nr:M23 family metallopeptidase [Cohnella algarum]MBN2984845.1 M23 family metallopeptidase [Cohnella algarum]